MGISERREREKESTKNLIISTAYGIVEQDGIENLSIRRIASIIEYSPMTIYVYFKNKEELLFSISNKAYEDFLKKSNLYSEHEPEARIRSRLREYLTFGINNPNVYKAVWSSGLSNNRRTNRVFQKEGIRILCSDIEDGINKKVFKEVNAESYSTIIWASVHGLTLSLLEEDDQQKVELQISLIINLIVDGLKSNMR